MEILLLKTDSNELLLYVSFNYHVYPNSIFQDNTENCIALWEKNSIAVLACMLLTW